MKEYEIYTFEDFNKSLKEIIKKLSESSYNNAYKFYKEVIKKIEFIKTFPKIYSEIRSVPEVRKVNIKNYIMFYLIEENIIYILDIIHEKSRFFNNQD